MKTKDALEFGQAHTVNSFGFQRPRVGKSIGLQSSELMNQLNHNKICFLREHSQLFFLKEQFIDTQFCESTLLMINFLLAFSERSQLK